MYNDFILHNYRFPKNKGVLKNPDVQYVMNNQLCGDKIAMFLKIKKNTVTDICFEGFGCVISIASASLLTEYSKKKKVYVLKKLDASFITKMLRVQLLPNRLKCALLPLEVLQKALIRYDSSKTQRSPKSIRSG